MYNFLDELKNEMNKTVTENGAGALRSTKSALLDAFGSLGAMRFANDQQIIDTFAAAFHEDRADAMRMLFYMRDIRGGQGARRVFRVIMTWLAQNYPNYVINNLDNFLYYGRGDDVLCLYKTPVWGYVVSWMVNQLSHDVMDMHSNLPCSLLAKWMPSENTSSKQTRKIARDIIAHTDLTAKQYRRVLVDLRAYLKVVEQKMSARDWANIDYEKVPAKAALRYSDAFQKHDYLGYYQYLMDLVNGDKKINAASLFPVDIIHRAFELGYNASLKDKVVLDAMWNALPNYLEGREETGICVVDVSGSMSGLPMEVAISLGMYCGDKCRGPFQGHFITFSSHPELIKIEGEHIVDKVNNISRADWEMNTNLEAVFNLILTTAVRNHTAPQDMPQKLYIISDMQFDAAREDHSYRWWGSDIYTSKANQPFMQKMRALYAKAGYEMPTIVYWNVRASECGMFQDTFEGENCCMVSGYSASLFKSIIDGTSYEVEETVDEHGNVVQTVKAKVDPMVVMMTAIHDKRYDLVWVG